MPVAWPKMKTGTSIKVMFHESGKKGPFKPNWADSSPEVPETALAGGQSGQGGEDLLQDELPVLLVAIEHLCGAARVKNVSQEAASFTDRKYLLN